ncbi:hypothetical protein SUNI508_02501 [Seiridium unicorne]|uniref:Uncharacterized protein n=1 Tax=Seiridium unicorne TaxID=138068 RepID=A0ABR2UF96_9PEZI
MCEKHYYYNTTRDGVREKQTRTERCSQALRRGTACENPQKFKHPEGERAPQSSTTQFLSANFPPSPPSSDTSYAPSGSEGERSHKRRSGIYINGEKVAEMGRKPSRRERRNSNHVVIVEPPASPRTPPRYETPMGSPSRSPPTYTHEPRSRHQPSYYTRPEVSMEVNRPRRDSAIHYDYVSPKSKPRRDSYSQGSSSVSDEEARLRELRRELRKAEEAKKNAEEAQRKAEQGRKKAEEARQEAARQERIQKIRRQNEDIANRPIVPSAPAPSKYRRGSVSVKQSEAVLAEAMRNVHLEADKDRRRREKRAQEQREQQQREEDAAQRERLRARMAPQVQRSNTVGHGGARRPTVVFNDQY